MTLRSYIVGTSTLALIVSGCASSNSVEKLQSGSTLSGGGPAACLQITEDDIDTNYGGTVAEGAVLWGVLGAAVGALAGAATGDSGAIATGAAIGGGAGATYGAVDGVQTAEAKEQYAVQEAQLDCQIEAAQADNAKLTGLVSNMKAAVAKTEKQLADLESAYVAKRVSREQAQKELAAIDESTAQLQRSLTSLQKRRNEYQQARTSTQSAANNSLDTAELDQQINKLNQQIAAAQTDLDRLTERRKVAQVG